MSLRIELKNNYVITADKDNYILSKMTIKKDKDGKDTEVQADKRFYPTINQALKRYIRVIPIEQEETITTMKDYMDMITDLEQEVEDLTHGY